MTRPARTRHLGAPAPSTRLITRDLRVWLTAASVATLADGLLYFGLGWEAARLGGEVAAGILTLVTLPRVLLLLTGGAVADRWGLRRTVLCSDALLCLLLVALFAPSGGEPGGGVLATLALTLGVVSAFRLPAAGAFPRLLSDGPQLAPAMALSGTVLSTARLVGPVLGGLAVAAVALDGVVLLAAAGYVTVFLLVIRVRVPERPPSARRLSGTLTVARRTPGVVPLLLAVGVLAGTVLPVLVLLLPLTARARGWTAGQTGAVEACWLVGTVIVGLAVTRRGARPQVLGPLVGGPVLAAVGTLLVAVAGGPGLAAGGAVVLGVGTAVFTSHALPVLVRLTPDGMLARFQALLGLAQSAVLLVAMNVVGALSTATSPPVALIAAGATCLLSGAAVLASPVLRSTRLP